MVGGERGVARYPGAIAAAVFGGVDAQRGSAGMAVV